MKKKKTIYIIFLALSVFFFLPHTPFTTALLNLFLTCISHTTVLLHNNYDSMFLLISYTRIVCLIGFLLCTFYPFQKGVFISLYEINSLWYLEGRPKKKFMNTVREDVWRRKVQRTSWDGDRWFPLATPNATSREIWNSVFYPLL